MAKNQQSIPKIMKITIDSYPQNSKVWQFKIEMGEKTDKKIEKTICPKDIFKGALTNFETLLNALRMLNYSVEPLRKNVDNTLANMKKLRENLVEEQKPKKKLSTHEIRERQKIHDASLRQAKTQITLLSTATDTIKKNLSSEGMLERIALALTLTEMVTFEDIEKAISSKSKKFEIILPITRYPDLSAMHSQQGTQLLSTIESALSLGSSVAHGIGF